MGPLGKTTADRGSGIGAGTSQWFGVGRLLGRWPFHALFFFLETLHLLDDVPAKTGFSLHFPFFGYSSTFGLCLPELCTKKARVTP